MSSVHCQFLFCYDHDRKEKFQYNMTACSGWERIRPNQIIRRARRGRNNYIRFIEPDASQTSSLDNRLFTTSLHEPRRLKVTIL